MTIKKEEVVSLGIVLKTHPYKESDSLVTVYFKDYGKSVYGKKRFENTISFSLNLSKLDLLNTQRVIHLVGL